MPGESGVKVTWLGGSSLQAGDPVGSPRGSLNPTLSMLAQGLCCVSLRRVTVALMGFQGCQETRGTG